MREVVYTHRAHIDLQEIWQYTARRWNTDQADIYLGQLLETCTSLASGLAGGRDAKNIQAGLRKQTVGSHVV
jgi:plasmid stabilization system protein ParE